jgi:hypothetical protein
LNEKWGRFFHYFLLFGVSTGLVLSSFLDELLYSVSMMLLQTEQNFWLLLLRINPLILLVFDGHVISKFAFTIILLNFGRTTSRFNLYMPYAVTQITPQSHLYTKSNIAKVILKYKHAKKASKEAVTLPNYNFESFYDL